ncbi:GntR family transcriptional regulator [Cognatishimia sp. SS12]|uniref:GntR family transcriptional regulator n=1 Tax=Cognatishimia sp. SS12 TaxID=2979465 RepID=UPI00232AD2CD|nr:GntR family transcriptional regulator [Cognatishimia sp. SS12]MDC0737990.1 GntR family transcriptional regulator [Cognatishimia sp. SS12]
MTEEMQSVAQSAAAPIYRALKASILASDLPAGRALRQSEIAKQFGVSKVPVREALQKLEAEGFVLLLPNKGAFVREVPAEEVLDLLDIRAALESQAVENAVPQMIETDLQALQANLKAYSEAPDIPAWSQLNLEFHRMLCEPCGNTQLMLMLEDIQLRIGPFLRLTVTEASGMERPRRDHDLIVQACLSGNAKEAAALVRRHIQETKKEVAAFMRRQPSRSTNI